ncbi:hypothetical protein LIER_06806 [Lithospermum erythrorhizon]|uniref:CCHC-type domain-containing protein n=1 Tax=Lithospermum erythrorhizon TaxID=34254 RepID=A0AAV3P5W9_LITER
MNMEDYLYGKKLHKPLGEKPANMEMEEWNELDRQVLGIVRPCLSRNVVANVAKETTTKGLMIALSGLYEKPFANNKVRFMKQLFHLRMSMNTPIARHLNDFNSLINQLSTVEVNFEDELQELILLASLPDSWEPMRAPVSNSVGNEKLQLKVVEERCLSEEVRKNDGIEKGSALNVDRGRNYNKGSVKNKWRSKSRGKSKSNFGGRTLECWGCGKTGHMLRQCKASGS